jgi:hypothetical protein
LTLNFSPILVSPVSPDHAHPTNGLKVLIYAAFFRLLFLIPYFTNGLINGGLDDRVIEVRSPTGAEDFSFSPYVQTGSEAHPASYPMGTGGPFLGGKAQPGRDADHSPPSSGRG